MMRMMACLPVLLGNLLLSEAFVVIPPRSMYEMSGRNLYEDIRNLTSRVESLTESHQNYAASFLELQKNHTDVATSTNERLKALEENLLKLKTNVEEHHRVPPCPSEFILIDNHKLCFKILVETVKRTQRDHNERCSELIDNGRLVKVETLAKVKAIAKYLKPGGYVIGGRLSRRTKKWIWLDGTPVDTTLFRNGKASYYLPEFVLTLYGSSPGSHRLRGLVESGRYRFICELPM